MENRYHITVAVAGRNLDFMKPMPDPFHSTTVTIGRRDLIRGLIRGHVEVWVSVGADHDLMEAVGELDPDYLGDANSKSRKRWNKTLEAHLSDFAARDQAAEREG